MRSYELCGDMTIEMYKAEAAYIKAVCALIGRTEVDVEKDLSYMTIQECMEYGDTPEEAADFYIKNRD